VWTLAAFEKALNRALHFAPRLQNSSLFYLTALIDLGANINGRSFDGSTALQSSAFARQPEMFDHLLPFTNLANADRGGRNVLTDAFDGGHPAILRSALHIAPSLIDMRRSSTLVALMHRTAPDALHDLLRARETLTPLRYNDPGLAIIASPPGLVNSTVVHTLLHCGVYPGGSAELASTVLDRSADPLEFARFLLSERDVAAAAAVAAQPAPRQNGAENGTDTDAGYGGKMAALSMATACADTCAVVGTGASTGADPSGGAGAAEGTAVDASDDDTSVTPAVWHLSQRTLRRAVGIAATKAHVGALDTLIELGGPVHVAWERVFDTAVRSRTVLAAHEATKRLPVPEMREATVLALLARADFRANQWAYAPAEQVGSASPGDFARQLAVPKTADESDSSADEDSEECGGSSSSSAVEVGVGAFALNPDQLMTMLISNGWTTAAGFAAARGVPINSPQGRRDLRRIRQARALQPYLFRQTYRPENLGSLADGGAAHAHPHAAPVLQPSADLSTAERAVAERALAHLMREAPRPQPVRLRPQTASPLSVAVARGLRPAVDLLLSLGATDTSAAGTFTLGLLLVTLPDAAYEDGGDALHIATTLVERGVRVSFDFARETAEVDNFVLSSAMRYGWGQNTTESVAFPVHNSVHNPPVLRALLRGRGLLINQRNHKNQSALAIAITMCKMNPSSFVALIEAGASVIRESDPRSARQDSPPLALDAVDPVATFGSSSKVRGTHGDDEEQTADWASAESEEGRLMLLPQLSYADAMTTPAVLVTLIGRAAVETRDVCALRLLRARILARSGADYFNIMPRLTRDIMTLSS
jgi:hypothetical protein